ncbi:MAG TPA: hypothetical protein VOA41_08915 [Candidatus Dormibacteraeota bacterium]|nr:hypothetical protein [Candidatus Dormibacteraeota bacterium]
MPENNLEIKVIATVDQLQAGMNAAAAATQEATAKIAAAFGSVENAPAGLQNAAMAGLPFPVNVATAPGVMASAIAETLSNLSLASAAGGGWKLQADMPLLAHKDEMVLPAAQAQGLRDLIDGGAGFGGGSITVHYKPTINAIDSYGMEDVLRRERGALVAALKQAHREGMF